MDSWPVNWEALDALIIDFAKSENLIEDSSQPSSPSLNSSYHSRLINRQIRRSLEVGNIDAAIDILRVHAPFVLEDHRLLFRLQKLKFIELLRKGTRDDRIFAIDYLRKSLAPCALNAYPEAYEEFKHVLLAFIYDKDDQTSPVANEWAEKRRYEIAGLVSSVLRAHFHAYNPIFSMALRYLMSIHKGFCFRQGIVSPISNLTKRLLLEERDFPALPPESLYEAQVFDEVDIQALAHAVELTRQGAIDSLRFAKGDLFQAFQIHTGHDGVYLIFQMLKISHMHHLTFWSRPRNEICRMRLDDAMLDELVREYCVYRGIVEPGMQTSSEPLKVNPPESGCCSSLDSSIDVDHSIAKHSNSETSATTDLSSMQGIDVELRFASEPTNNLEDCSPSGSHQSESSSLLRNRSKGAGERSKRKRWRGRHDDLDFISGVHFNRDGKQEVSTTISKGVECTSAEDKYEIVLQMKELASRGMAAEVVEEISTLDPDFFVQNPVLLFQLKQVEFLKLVGLGDHSGALRVACSHLGPLAARDPNLLKPLKETLLSLLRPNEEALVTGSPLHALATSLQVAFGKRLGIEEPQLMRIMRATLHTHTEWFKLQMCKDRFGSLLRIDSLKENNTPVLTSLATSKSNIDSCTLGSSQATISSTTGVSDDSSSPNQASSQDAICDENAILKVMEFLALPRADAIHLLAQYNGNAETVIQQIFA
ncbi:C-terminal LisH motif isoform 1 [Gossypium australe]|uniref:C-terminal LisH motif isoform 1 n=1 Tax=Gossypium australe TaxID=47621 RepID=A0A5B6UKR2_9ROSI|nr:C-terminal LisH motif isoform 1 [Gossypium australe]